MCADCQAARGYGTGPYPVMTRAQRESLALLPSWVLVQKAAANRQLSPSRASGWRLVSKWPGCIRSRAGLVGASAEAAEDLLPERQAADHPVDGG